MSVIDLFGTLLEMDIAIKVIESVLIILALYVFRWIVAQILDQYISDVRERYHWRKTLTYVFAILAIFLISPLWVSHTQSLATFLGLVSAGVAIAMRDPLVNLFGWVFIIWRRPFEVGDRIQLGPNAGDVVDIRIFEFTLLEIGNWIDAEQSTGRVLHMPNGMLFNHVLANYSKGFDYIWNEIKVRITFESNWEKAKKILEQIATDHIAPLSQDAPDHVRKATKRYLIVYSKLTPIVYMRVDRDGIRLTLRYLCQPRRRRSSEQIIWEFVLRHFAVHEDIEFAYPTQRLYSRHLEKQSSPSITDYDFIYNGLETPSTKT